MTIQQQETWPKIIKLAPGDSFTNQPDWKIERQRRNSGFYRRKQSKFALGNRNKWKK